MRTPWLSLHSPMEWQMGPGLMSSWRSQMVVERPLDLHAPHWRQPQLVRSYQTDGSHLTFAVCTDFSIAAWDATIEVAKVYSSLWPACWIQCPDRPRQSSSQAVQNIWDVYIQERPLG